MPDKEYKIDFGLDSDKNYLDDGRQSANLKKGSVDKTGAAKYGKKQNMFGSYVADLQEDLKKFNIKDVGDADGDFGNNTLKAVKEFQMASQCTLRDLDETPQELPSITMSSDVDGIVGEKTKSEIKLWKDNNYKSPWGTLYPVPLIKQTYQLSCWAASIQMLHKYNGKNTSQEELAKIAGIRDMNTDGGPREQDMQALARRFGLEPIAPGNFDFGQWSQLLSDKGPLIITGLWYLDEGTPNEQKGSHTVLVTGASKNYAGSNYILINDPGGNYDLKTFEGFRKYIEDYSTNKDWDDYIKAHPAEKDRENANRAYSIYYYKP